MHFDSCVCMERLILLECSTTEGWLQLLLTCTCSMFMVKNATKCFNFSGGFLFEFYICVYGCTCVCVCVCVCVLVCVCYMFCGIGLSRFALSKITHASEAPSVSLVYKICVMAIFSVSTKKSNPVFL